MLQELLLALSGHPSPLLSEPVGEINVSLFTDYLSPAESALLQTLAQDLGVRHKKICDTASAINFTHPSVVCRAVATSIKLTHLANFQRTILDIEKDILEENPGIVGAFKIVPLSGVLWEFQDWSCKLKFLLSLVDFIDTPNESDKLDEGAFSRPASQVLGWLRDSTHTGYPDIEQMSNDLLKVAETAWLKQVSAWLLYGRLPTLGIADFFIHKEKDDEEGQSYVINKHLLPDFVPQVTANSILFIGKSLNHMRDRASSMQGGTSPTQSGLPLLPIHLAHLSSLDIPITATSLSTAISAIRLSLSRNALQRLLPLSKVLEMLRILKDFFLLEHGEFAIALVQAADQRLLTRQSRFADKLPPKAGDPLKNAIIKEGEVSAVLGCTWAAITSLQGLDDENEVEDIEVARDLINMSIRPPDPVSSSNKGVVVPSFDDVLLPTPTTLGLRVPSPLDLFLAPSDVDTYSHIHAYLLSIRRAHFRLSQLFLLSVLRREHPSPKASSHHSVREQTAALRRMRERAARRTKTLRPVWATIRSAVFLLTEMREYLQGGVVKTSWDGFHTWLGPDSEDKGNRPGTASSTDAVPGTFGAFYSSRRSIQPREQALHDPESLTVAHRTYLSSLIHALLLDDARFTKELRTFLNSIDYLSAVMARLDITYKHLDFESDHGVVDTFTNYKVDEKEVMQELRPAREKVARGVEAVIAALRDVDAARTGNEIHSADVHLDGEDLFTPQMSAGIDRLLLKLDFAEMQRVSPVGPL